MSFSQLVLKVVVVLCNKDLLNMKQVFRLKSLIMDKRNLFVMSNRLNSRHKHKMNYLFGSWLFPCDHFNYH
jgi:hypothetical protein